MTRRQRILKRNENVRSMFDGMINKYPHWRVEFVVSQIAAKMYLSERTVWAIIKCEGIYDIRRPKMVDKRQLALF